MAFVGMLPLRCDLFFETSQSCYGDNGVFVEVLDGVQVRYRGNRIRNVSKYRDGF